MRYLVRVKSNRSLFFRPSNLQLVKFIRKNIPLIISVLFVVLLFVFESVFMPFKQQNGADFSALALEYFLTAASLFLTTVFVYFAVGAPYQYRLLYLIMFALATAVEYGYYSTLQRFTTAEDLENVLFGTNFDNKIDAVMMYANAASFAPAVAFLILLLVVKPRANGGWKKSAAICLLTFSFFTLTGALTANVFPTLSGAAFYRTTIGAPWKSDLINFTPREQIEFRAAEKPSNNIVLIIDESISGTHLSLNGYNRPTTPFLERLNERGFIKNWGLAVSGTTCSITSNKLLLTGITDLPDLTKQTMKKPLIYQYAKASGYKTFYFDGQMDNLWSLNDFDRQFIDEWTTKEKLQTANDYEIDAEIARRTKEIVSRSTANFIVINKRGTHVPYSRAYPKTAQTWLPVYFDEPQPVFNDAALEKQALINSHDNAVKFNLALFFETLLGDGLSAETFYIYTSDHGQNLRDVPDEGSHCIDAPQSAIVPLFIAANSARLQTTDTDYKASHSNIFATILDLMNFPEGERKYDYNLSLLKATTVDSKPRSFFYGDLTGAGDGRKIAFDENLTVSRK